MRLAIFTALSLLNPEAKLWSAGLWGKPVGYLWESLWPFGMQWVREPCKAAFRSGKSKCRRRHLNFQLQISIAPLYSEAGNDLPHPYCFCSTVSLKIVCECTMSTHLPLCQESNIPRPRNDTFSLPSPPTGFIPCFAGGDFGCDIKDGSNQSIECLLGQVNRVAEERGRRGMGKSIPAHPECSLHSFWGRSNMLHRTGWRNASSPLSQLQPGVEHRLPSSLMVLPAPFSEQITELQSRLQWFVVF